MNIVIQQMIINFNDFHWLRNFASTSLVYVYALVLTIYVLTLIFFCKVSLTSSLVTKETEMSATALIVISVVTVTSLYALFNFFDWESLKNVSKETAAICITVTLLLVTLCFKWGGNSKKTIITNNLENQIGYLIPPGRSRKQVIRMLRQVKIAGEIPPLYPNSWYEVMRSDELPIGGVKAVYLIEKHLVVFRNEKGTVCVMDAYCPHLGANLGIGGIVKGNCIKCPFHGWEFDGETGKCTTIPYTDNAVPSYAKTNVWHSIERNGFICVWFDAEGREPAYFPEDIAQIVTKKWTYRGCCVHYINAHIQVLNCQCTEYSAGNLLYQDILSKDTSVYNQD